jgi:tRNA nucleotidyltransferase/poly(A) polymerase
MRRTSQPSPLDPDEQRSFALDVVRRLRERGFEALWAGGCVRDHLLGRRPKDYDVATNALPPAVQEVFGTRRTLAIGAAFGVIAVIGSRKQGMVEVTTFRCDERYGKGHRPESVSFGSPEEDARRRDFTINGLFFDPIEQRVIDYVGGRDDLERRVVRAIGDPRERFIEDKLRMLRAVRMATTLDFSLDEPTASALRTMASEIDEISAERIAQELRLMLALDQRRRALEILRETGLLGAILPEATMDDAAWTPTMDVIAALPKASFALVMACLLGEASSLDPASLERQWSSVRRRLRLSNDEHRRVSWLLRHRRDLAQADTLPRSRIQPVLAAEPAHELVDWHAARPNVERTAIAFCRQKLQLPHEQLDPPPLVTGDDLATLGISPGREYAELLQAARDAQLDGVLRSKDEAIEFINARRA